MSPLVSDLATKTLAVSFLFAAYLIYLCTLPPNPVRSGPEAALPRDTLAVDANAVRIRRLVVLSFWIIHVLVTLTYPSPPAVLCPNPNNLSGSLFTLTPYTGAVLTTVAIAAPIRLLAFRQLGQNFTFRLARPSRLVTTGLYAYVQHPSYPTNWLISLCNIGLLFRLDGILGCVLPSSVVRWALGSGSIGFWPLLQFGLAVGGLWGIWQRVRDEEAMLKAEFKGEWEEYHRRTKRYIPGIF